MLKYFFYKMHELNCADKFTPTVGNKKCKVLGITGKSVSLATTCMEILLIEEENIHDEYTVLGTARLLMVWLHNKIVEHGVMHN